MFKIILFTHGGLAAGMLDTSRLIMGEQEAVESYSVEEGCNIEELKEIVKSSIKSSAKNNEEVLVLTDLMFGTPFNITVQLQDECSFSHITGVNLPLLLEALNRRTDSDLKTAMDGLLDTARQCMRDCSLLLEHSQAETSA